MYQRCCTEGAYVHVCVCVHVCCSEAVSADVLLCRLMADYDIKCL